MDTIKNALSNGASAAADTIDNLTNAKRKDLEKVTIDYSGHPGLTTAQGIKLENTDTALKAGVRGPTLIEDFHNREKITAFDHERIPERAVHARGAGAHGHFKLHTPIPELTKAAVLNDTSRTTPMFVRFSTVAGSRGSADSVRDVRGFATRFYTDEGNWDIVGNNIPVFFIQEAIQFPDLVHALKPEPHNEIPQAQSAHDNAWDWMGLQTQALHMNMWQLSDRTIPRSFRMMQGFGVNTYTFVAEDGKSRFVKFHWEPKLGSHGLVWDEALKLAGQDPDFHRRDLYDAIEAGAYPSWELGVQIIEQENEHDFDFDILDATKIWPEEQVPVKFIGTMTLNRNTDDYFAETEQVAFMTSNLVPGISFSNDPLLHGRNHSYLDTQISRLGINFHQYPINQPVCPVMSHIRDGKASHRIHRSKVNYHPNRFDTPTPVPEAKGGYVHPPDVIEAGHKVRARGPKFQEHVKQAQLFFNSMSPIEKKHICQAAAFELGKCEEEPVQQKMLENLNLVNRELAEFVAGELCLELTAPPPQVDGRKTDFVSMVTGRKNTFTAEGRKVGIFIMDGFDVKALTAIQTAIVGAKAMAMLVGEKQKIKSTDGIHKCQFTFDTCRSTHFDAIVIVGGSGDYQSKLNVGRLKHAAIEAYGHQKAILVQGQAVPWVTDVCLPGQGLAVSGDSGVTDGVVFAHTVPGPKDISTFIDLIANHRVWSRNVDSVAF